MQRPQPRAEPPLHQSDNQSDTFPERHYISDLYTTDGNYFGDTSSTPRDLGVSQDIHDSYTQIYGNANAFSQSHAPNVGLGAEGTVSNAPRDHGHTTRFTLLENNNLLRGVENSAELSSPSSRFLEPRSSETPFLLGSFPEYNIHRRSFSDEALAPMQPFPQPSSRHSSAPPQAAGQHYTPFLNRFKSSKQAKDYRHSKMRFNRKPWREPHTDPTIAEIECDRDRHVERIYNAMICGDHARDNLKSTALKRWVHEPHYQSDLVEAYAHKVFDCLLEQVKDGFRGWHQNDYVNDERKGEDDDKDIDCAGRLDNIITALEQEKSICENVMSSAWQIRMFVNAPKAYSKRKDQNRVGNSKRPNAKGNNMADDSPRAPKRPRAAPRNRQTCARSSTTSGLPTSRGATPQQPFEPMPYYTEPALRSVAAGTPTPGYLAPMAPSMRPASVSHRGSSGHQQAIRGSPQAQPHEPQAQNTLPIKSMPPVQHPAFSPSSKSHSHFSAPATPDNAKPVSMAQSYSPWEHSDSLNQQPRTALQHAGQSEDTFLMDVAGWSDNVQLYGPYEGSENANLFDQHPEMGVCLADVERGSHELEDDWYQQQDEQQVSYNGLPLNFQGQP